MSSYYLYVFAESEIIMIILKSLDKLLSKGFVFPIDKDLRSPATRVMLNNSSRIRQHFCLKMWLECNNGVYNTGDLARRTKYLLEGLQFNRHFAPDIYF